VRPGLAALAAALLALAAGCGGGDDGGSGAPADPAPPRAGGPIERDPGNAVRPAIVVGALNFPAQGLLAELYAQALRAAGYRVRVQATFGSEEAARAALRADRVDALPDYLAAVLGGDGPRTREAAYERAREVLGRSGLTALAPARFEDAPGYAIRRAEADGARALSELHFGLVLACAPDQDCAAPLESRYGLEFRRVIHVPVAERYAVLDEARADISAVFTADGALAGDRYVLLADDREALAPFHVTLVVRDEALEEAGDGLAAAVGRLQETLTLPVVQRLNRRVDGGAAPARVAAGHLRAAGLVR
jgi:osmoprotectant transport system substrate-binding protein